MLGKHFTGKGRVASTGALSSEEARKLTAALEERDAAIARLEQTLAEQQAEIATLRDALAQAAFQTRILEQSYSTQLSAARERAAAAERSVADRQTRLAELEASHEALGVELAAARKTLDAREASELGAASIDELLSSFTMPRERPPAYGTDGEADAPADPPGAEEMLAPEVMFAGKRK